MQLDEPALAADWPVDVPALVTRAYGALASRVERPKLLVAATYGELRENLARAVR